MSEKREGLVGQIKKKIERLTKPQEPDSKSKVLEAVMRYASNQNQEAVQTFDSGSPAEFDFEKLNIGTIIRCEDGYTQDDSVHFYEWLVVSRDDKNKPVVLHIYHKDDEEYAFNSGSTLKLGQSWDLAQMDISKTHFPVSEFDTVVFGADDFFYQYRKLSKIDIMDSGMRIKKEVKQEITQGKTKLVLERSNAN